MPAPTCECFWSCVPCQGSAIYGSYKQLPSTLGVTFFDANEFRGVGTGGTPKAGTPMKDGNPKRGRGGGDSIGGNQCLCGIPGPETGCPYCTKDGYIGPEKRKFGGEK